MAWHGTHHRPISEATSHGSPRAISFHAVPVCELSQGADHLGMF
jgi:hypothetical protein